MLFNFSLFFFQSAGCRWWIGMILTWSFTNLMHAFKLTIPQIKVIQIENIWSNWILRKQTGSMFENGPMAWPDTWRKTGHCAAGLAFTIVQMQLIFCTSIGVKLLQQKRKFDLTLVFLNLRKNGSVYSSFSLNNNSLLFWLGKEWISAPKRHEYQHKTCHTSSSCSWLNNLV